MSLNAESIVKVLQIKGLGRSKILKLINRITRTPSNDKELAEIVIENSKELGLVLVPYSEIINSFAKGDDIIEKSYSKGIKLISFDDTNYPNLLRHVKSPPVLLNVLGDNVGLLNNPSVAVIGTRDVSSYGKQIGERIGFKLGQNKINVVSGLAVGCDTAAHVGCLKANGTTIAILAHGLDYIYPKENTKLAQIIVEQGGMLISEYFVGTRGLPNFFVERDRIQAGMCKATIVIETDIKGGTMHTVRDTIEANRILAAFNHPVDKQFEKSRGNQLLINEGKAISLQTKEDIERLINQVNPQVTNLLESEIKTQILDIQLPLYETEVFNSLVTPIEKKKKERKKKIKRLAPPKMFNMISVIFDLDLTLVDTNLAAAERTSRSWNNVYQLIPEFTMYEGIFAVLGYLKENSIVYSIVTSSPSTYCKKVCSHFDIDSSHIVCYHDTKKRKPHPEPIEKAVAKMATVKNRVISFGDRDIDIISSNAAGVISVACMWGCEDRAAIIAANPNFIIEQPSEIIPLIGAIQSSM